MRFHVPLLLAITAVAQATPVLNEFVKRDGAAVIDAVNTISEGMVTLNTTVTSYRGGLLGTITALQIEFQSIALSNDLRAGIRTTTDSANFTEDESLQVSGAFIDLQPNIFSTLDNIVSKKAQFDNGLLGIGSLAFLVRSNLETQRDLAAQLGAAVVEKLTATYAIIAPLLNAQIAAKFDEAIAMFD
ncbi:hydrophobic surface binding protein A-domain-containing protein [Aspergillus cavernicola]|uniref:Hydrophobic surface binding protein A-domain-containing protein n=1 Tax=Aspergillus cavernicola TaxID=176166 RepID=A0ABR4HF18_9EURO